MIDYFYLIFYSLFAYSFAYICMCKYASCTVALISQCKALSFLSHYNSKYLGFRVFSWLGVKRWGLEWDKSGLWQRELLLLLLYWNENCWSLQGSVSTPSKSRPMPEVTFNLRHIYYIPWQSTYPFLLSDFSRKGLQNMHRANSAACMCRFCNSYWFSVTFLSGVVGCNNWMRSLAVF